jgi:hypothetical protein
MFQRKISHPETGKMVFVQFTREIKLASCGSFTLFIAFRRELLMDLLAMMNGFFAQVTRAFASIDTKKGKIFSFD